MCMCGSYDSNQVDYSRRLGVSHTTNFSIAFLAKLYTLDYVCMEDVINVMILGYY